MKKIDKKRRIENRTNYHKRLILLKSGALRMVVRKSNKYILLQIVESSHAQDKVLLQVSTKDLLKYGWPEAKQGSLKSLSAAYLAGCLIAKKTKDIKGRIILDSGLIPNTKGSRVYAAVKGAGDSGLEIKFDESISPDMEKVEGIEFFNKVKENIKNG
jgi:large subunit ribosomal protein L18